VTFTVLVTAAGGGLSAATVRALKASRRHAIRVVAVDAGSGPRAPVAAHFADAFHRVPRGDAPGYVERLAGIVAAERVDLVLPCSDEEALALARARGAVEAAGARLAAADAGLLDVLSDKAAAYRFLAERGLPVPRFALCRDRTELAAALAEFRRWGEFVVRPAQSRGNRGVRVVRADMTGLVRSHSGRELHMDAATFARDHEGALVGDLPLLVSERLREPVFDIDILSWRGEAMRVVPRRRLNPEGMPFLGNVVESRADLVELGRRVAAALGLSWLYDIDAMSAADGTPRIIEVNPRPSGSVVAAVAAGAPLLDDLVSLARGESLPPAPPLAAATVLPVTDLAVLP
jgi:carbamoyl-phosphate synthase large subunit